MDIDFLRTFLEVNKTKHFGKAARSLFVTQSTISSRIKMLEESIGYQLFSRNRNDIQLTLAGENLLPQAEMIVSLWDETKRSMGYAEENFKSLVVGSVSVLWDLILADWLNKLKRSMPNLSFKGESLSAEGQIRGILAKTMDLGFMFEPPNIPELTAKILMEVELVLVSTKQRTSVRDAMQEGYIMVDWGTSFMAQHQQAFPEISIPAVHLDLGRWAIEYLLIAGGSAYLAKPMVEDHIKRGELIEVDDAPVFTRKAFVVYHSYSKNLDCIENSLGYLKGNL